MRLEDVLAVFTGTEAPDAYDGWTPTDLANAVKPYGVSTGQVWGQTSEGKSANRRGLIRDAVLDAIAKSLG